VTKASQAAMEAIESKGGKVTCVYHNKLGLRALLNPDKFDTVPKQALPARANVVEWYKNPKNRGYLATS
jgi:large subunit ribosomal protein L15